MFQISKKSVGFFALAEIMFSSFALTFQGKLDITGADNYFKKADSYLEKAQFDSSLYYFQKSADLWREEKNWKNYLKCQIGISNNFIKKSDVSNALQTLQSAEHIALSFYDSTSEEMGRIYALLGYIHSYKEEYDEAITKTLKGISVYTKCFPAENERAASAYYTLGIALFGKGKYDEATEALLKAKTLQVTLSGENYYGLSNTYTLLGTVYQAKNEFEKSESCYHQALKIFSVNNAVNTADAATCQLYLMSSLSNRGEYFQAVECGKKAIEIYSAISLSHHPNVPSTYSKLGEIYTAVGDFEKAKEYLEQSLQIFSSQYPEKKSAIGKLYYLLSDVYKQTGDAKNALSSSLKGMVILEESFGELHPEIGFLYKQLAGIYAEQRNIADALKYYRKAIAARERVGETSSRSDIAALYSSMADLYIKDSQRHSASGSIDSAFTYLTLASGTFAQSSQRDIPQEALLSKRYGDTYLLKKNHDRALEEYQQAVNLLANSASMNNSELPSFEQSIYKKELLDVVLQKAVVFEKLYSVKKRRDDLKTALYHYGRAIDLVDGIRKQFSYDGSKFYLVEKSASVYGNACRVALALHSVTGEARYNEAAFLIADRSKANILLEKLFDGEAKQFAGIPDSLLQYEKVLLRDIAFSETKIQQESGDKQNHLRTAIFDLRTKHQQLIDVFERQYPKYYELKYAQYSVTSRDIQQNLEPHTALVEYLVDKKSIYVFCLTKNNLTVKTLQGAEKIDAQVERFSSSLRKYDTDGYVSSAKELYVSLLEPLTKSLASVSALIIIPDGNLCYVPFEALMSRGGGNSSVAKTSAVDFTSLPYLISTYDISYSYSAAFYKKMIAARSHEDDKAGSQVSPPWGDKGAVSFAGFAPVFRDSTKNGDFLANRSYVEASGISDVRSITLDGKTFNELKYSEEEVVSIGNTFNSRSLPYHNFLHTSATESNFKQYASRYDILHVATHGFINESNPKLSAILFSQPFVPDAQDDGILHVNETFNLDLHAKLVVLSSCESGIGKLVKGEGMIALTRGLFYAGAKNIIFSLWKVSDKQTYLLMDEFYKQMLSGKSYTSSLRAAKLKMISSRESAFPSKWSGFVLVGE